MKSIVTKLCNAVSIAGTSAPGTISTHPNPNGDNTATSLFPQRIADESCSFQVQVNQDPDPGGGSDGKIVLQGRLDSDAGWADIGEVDLTDFDGGGTLTQIVTGLTAVAEMQVVAVAESSYNVAAGTTVQVWVQE